MLRSVCRNHRLSPVLLLVLCLSSSPGRGQGDDVYPPPDSPFASVESDYWLPLSDSLTKAQLRDTLNDPAAHRKRYEQGVIARRIDPVSDPERVSYCVVGALTPQLFRAPEVFEMFTLTALNRPAWPSDVRRQLAAYEMSSEGIDTVVTMTSRNWSEHATLMDELRPQKEEFIEVVREAGERLGPRAAGVRDVDLLAQASGPPADEVARLLAAFRRDPEEVSIRNLVLLRGALSAADWQAFRAFLLNEVATTMSALGVAPQGEGR